MDIERIGKLAANGRRRKTPPPSGLPRTVTSFARRHAGQGPGLLREWQDFPSFGKRREQPHPETAKPVFRRYGSKRGFLHGTGDDSKKYRQPSGPVIVVTRINSLEKRCTFSLNSDLVKKGILKCPERVLDIAQQPRARLNWTMLSLEVYLLSQYIVVAKRFMYACISKEHFENTLCPKLWPEMRAV